MGGIETGLNEILTLWLGDKGLKLCSSEGVDKTSLRDNKQEDLGASEGGQFICLCRCMSCQKNMSNQAAQLPFS